MGHFKGSLSLPLLGFFLAMGLVVSTLLLSQTIRRSIPSNQVVKVRGVAEEMIDLDRVEWTINIEVLEVDLKTAYNEIDQSIEATKTFLRYKKVDMSTIELGGYLLHRKTKNVRIDNKGNVKEEFVGHQVSRQLKIKRSTQLDLIEKLAKTLSGEMARKNGLSLLSLEPTFFISSDPVQLKKRLLEQASANAYFRASIIAKNSHSSLGGLRAARQGDYTGINYNGRIQGPKRRHRVTSLVTVDYALK